MVSSSICICVPDFLNCRDFWKLFSGKNSAHLRLSRNELLRELSDALNSTLEGGWENKDFIDVVNDEIGDSDRDENAELHFEN